MQCTILAALVLAAGVPHLRLVSGATQPVPLVLPTGTSDQLEVHAEGLQLLKGLDGPIAPVVVIGPYRSGKSFLLNQLLQVPCDQGFGVGHTRATQTKGIWLWGEPQTKTNPDGTSTAVLLVDTEGFEATGKSNSYDDRIFAVSCLLSSLLIYNLPETIRESDISKLSFAVELAQGFYEKMETPPAHADEGGRVGATLAPGPQEPGEDAAGEDQGAGPLQPGSMLWLIQRDFLQGKPAADIVREALAPVPNPSGDQEVEQLNTVRASLHSIAANSTGYSLRQPHLERTKLCELSTTDLDPGYVEQMARLRTMVQQMAQPKLVGSKPVTGRQLAALLTRMVFALNQQEIPNVASMLVVFNHDLVVRCVRAFASKLKSIELPAEESRLEAAVEQGKRQALDMFRGRQLGRRSKARGPAGADGGDLEGELDKMLEQEAHIRRTENEAASIRVCSDLEERCEQQLDGLQAMRLPSLHKFTTEFHRCRSEFEAKCPAGLPGRMKQQGRLERAWQRSNAVFLKDYNDRLFTGLVFVSLGAVVLFRFVFPIRILEAAGWAAIIFLEGASHLAPGGARTMYETRWWHITVAGWEAAMFLLFGFSGAWVLWLALVGAALLSCRARIGGHGKARRGKKAMGAKDKDLDV